jgi:ribosomal protein S18 acetylase RimI-like enzyme
MNLDNPTWWALAGPQRELGVAISRAARFSPEVSPFGGFEGQPAAADWDDMATLTGPGGTVALIGAGPGDLKPPAGWTVAWESAGVQMVGAPGGVGRSVPIPGGGPTDAVVPLGTDDVPAMLALVAEARPGPFSSRTVEFGGYVGVRREGRLVAMAGERLRPPGHAEVSAVATDPGHRRQGLAELLIRAVVAGIVTRGEVPFLHAAGTNIDAIRLYQALGFTIRRTVWFTVVEAPPAGSSRAPTSAS